MFWSRLRDARSGSARPGWTHARSYVGWSPTNSCTGPGWPCCVGSGEFDLPAQGLVVDLGCSDGFVLAELRAVALSRPPGGWTATTTSPGCSRGEGATSRDRFQRIDLNDLVQGGRARHLVLCLETLEHVGDYRAALDVIHHAVRPGGLLVLTMPNESVSSGWSSSSGVRCPARCVRGLLRHPSPGPRYGIAVATYGDLERFRSAATPRLGTAPRIRPSAGDPVPDRTFVDPGLWPVERTARSRAWAPTCSSSYAAD